MFWWCVRYGASPQDLSSSWNEERLVSKQTTMLVRFELQVQASREWCLINQVRSVCTTVGGFCALVDLIIGCLCWHVVTELSNKPLCFDNFGMFISFLYTSELRLVPLLKQLSPFCLRIKMELHCPPETATTPSVTAGCGQVFGPFGSSWPHLSFDVSLVHRAKVHHCCTGCGGNTSSTGQTSY